MNHAIPYGVLIIPFLSLAGEGEGAVYPPVAVRPCQILNGINRKGRRQTHGGVTVEPIIGGDVTAAYVRNLHKN